VRFLVRAAHPKYNGEKRDQEGCDKERNGLEHISNGKDIAKTSLTSVAHSMLTKATIARQFCCSGCFIIGIMSRATKMEKITSKVYSVGLKIQTGQKYFPTGVEISFIASSASSPWRRIRCGSLSIPSIVFLMPRFAA
jgi:hypothetical protein